MAPVTTKPRTPIEAKAQAAGVSGVAAGIVLWVLQTYVFKGNSVPDGLVSLVDAAVPGLLALAGAYLAPHTYRFANGGIIPPGHTPPIPGIRPPAAPGGGA